MITPTFTMLDAPADDAIRRTPENTWADGFGALLDRIAKTVDREGVLILDRAAAHALKLPTAPDETVTTGIDEATAAGWTSGSLGAWVPFSADGRPTIVVGFADHPMFGRSPLVNPRWHHDTVGSVAMWHELSGRAWRGTPGIAAMTLMRDLLPTFRVRGNDVKPSRRYPAGPEGASEGDLDPRHWSRPQTMPYAHGYDATRMYLAAAGVCEVLAPWTLRHTGRMAFNPKLGGWWKVKLGPWSDARIPAPAGPGDRERWVTTPTLLHLTQLIEAAQADPSLTFQDFEVLDSWTGDGKRLLRQWADRIEAVYQGGRAHADKTGETTEDPQDGRRVMEAAKLSYKEGWGLLNHVRDDGKENAIFRPDWHYAILAQARWTLWSKVWTVGQTEDRWPLEIKTDHVWYESTDPDPITAKPAGIPLANRKGVTDALGTFKQKGTRTLPKGGKK